MKLQYVSLTGADDEIAIADMNSIAAEHPFAEFAILYMPEGQGQQRFPQTNWIRNFAENYLGAHKAMHLCGSAFLGFAAGDPAVLEVMEGFRRIQLNLKFGDVEGKYDPNELVAHVKAHPEWQFIIQYGKDKEGLLPLLRDIPNHAILFDESAGRGLNPERWDAPLPDHFCGYAGGLNPDNLQQNLEAIERAVGNQTTWIDMETGVRAADRFDLAKVRQVLEIAAPYAL